jgi:hypothetical protein
MSICPHGATQLPLARFSWHYVSEYFWKIVEKIQVLLKSDKNKGTLCDDHNTYLIIPHSVLLRMRNVSDKSCRGNQNTHFAFNNVFLKIVPFVR